MTAKPDTQKSLVQINGTELAIEERDSTAIGSP